MKCPYCGHLGDKVVDSRESKEGEVIRRRRECLGCARRFTSYERIDEIPYMVVKKDGSRERFERQSTEEVGAFVMNELRRLDKVAYVRFASVYRHFRDIGEFMSELKDLLNAKE
jgi:transcriptional repressor NrdR